MKRLSIAFLIAASAGLGVRADVASLIPAPAQYEVTADSYYTLPKQITVASTTTAGKNDVAPIVSYLKMRGIKANSGSLAKANLRLTADRAMSPESYRLAVSPDGISVTAADGAGFFYAVQSLFQLINQSTDGRLASCDITDTPRFGYRGIMLDVSRYFMPFDNLKKLVDIASMLKINTLHLHLTDDNGWRLEIKKYPKLTEVGAWRVDRPEIFPARQNQKEGEPATYGGFYTQKQMKELVKYAAERHINIIPEIEMPAHAVAALASYPELACPVVDEFIGVLPGIGGNKAAIIACAGNEKVYEFYQDVLDEVFEIFPSEYIHLGGDEANKTNWEKCPLCNKRLSDEGLKDFEELQGYFMDRINRYVQAHGRKAIGWDEVTYGQPKEDITVIGWQGDGKTAVNYAKQTGRNFIMSPAKKMYMIRYQGPQWFEPFTYFGNITLKDVYEFDPVTPEWSDSLKSQLLGIQASMWTEFCNSPQEVQYMLFPRVLAAADAAWRTEGKNDWPAFVKAVDSFVAVLDDNGITYARSMYNLDHKVTPADGALTVELSCIRPDVEIMWATDEAFAHSALYSQPISVDKPTTIYAATFKGGKQMGKTLRLPLEFNKATGRPVNAVNCNNGIPYTLTNGLRGSDRNSDFEWAGWHNGTADFTVDLGKSMPITGICLGVLANSDICIAAPIEVFVYTSDNGNSFQLLKKIEVPADKIYAKGANRIDLDCGPVDTSARYVRFTAVNPGRIPDGMPREMAPTWMYFDEISIR